VNNYSLFIVRLATALKQSSWSKQRVSKGRSPLLLSVALHAWQTGRDRGLSAAAIAAVDRAHVMAYDDGQDAQRRHSTLEHFELCGRAMVQNGGWPAHKLILGVPFFGRKQGDFDALTWQDQVKEHLKHSGHLRVNEDTVGGAWCNGIQMAARKALRARKQGYGGVFAWELGQDSFDRYSLLGALVHGASQTSKPPGQLALVSEQGRRDAQRDYEAVKRQT